jgi:hypothetical protein
MPYIVANGFERKLGVDQPLDARVSKGVGSRPMHFDACFLNVNRDP